MSRSLTAALVVACAGVFIMAAAAVSIQESADSATEAQLVITTSDGARETIAMMPHPKSKGKLIGRLDLDDGHALLGETIAWYSSVPVRNVRGTVANTETGTRVVVVTADSKHRSLGTSMGPVTNDCPDGELLIQANSGSCSNPGTPTNLCVPESELTSGNRKVLARFVSQETGYNYQTQVELRKTSNTTAQITVLDLEGTDGDLCSLTCSEDVPVTMGSGNMNEVDITLGVCMERCGPSDSYQAAMADGYRNRDAFWCDEAREERAGSFFNCGGGGIELDECETSNARRRDVGMRRRGYNTCGITQPAPTTGTWTYTNTNHATTCRRRGVARDPTPPPTPYPTPPPTSPTPPPTPSPTQTPTSPTRAPTRNPTPPPTSQRRRRTNDS